tara:strand:- start:538 stop:2121 length:1584 start_codon:yes stop_codon:yes gene_type:complete
MNNVPQGNQPIFIMKEGTERIRGKPAQSNNIAAAKAVAESVRSTLGPEGADKMLVDPSGDVVITNDGATILNRLDVEHPAAKLIIEVSETQEQEAHDGTTSAAILAGALLEKAEDLLDDSIHQTIICRGYRQAYDLVKEELGNLGWDAEDVDLTDVARTSLTGKSAEGAMDVIANICVQAMTAIGPNGTLDDVMVASFSGGTYAESSLIEGVLIEKERPHSEMPSHLTDAHVLLVTEEIGIKETKFDTTLNIKNPDQVKDFLAQEEEMLKDMCAQIVASGANAVFCQKEVDDLAMHYLAKAGIFCLKRVKRSKIEALRKATGAKLVNGLDNIESDDIGVASEVKEVKFGDYHCTVVKSDTTTSVTACLRGSTGHAVDEIERAWEDSMGVVYLSARAKTLLAGGGAAYAHLARHLRRKATTMGDRKGMAINAFSEALESIPRTLAENAGIDPVDAVLALRRAKSPDYGINTLGKVVDMREARVIEPRKVVEMALGSATEAAIMILRIDDVISMKAGDGGMPPMPGMMG